MCPRWQPALQVSIAVQVVPGLSPHPSESSSGHYTSRGPPAERSGHRRNSSQGRNGQSGGRGAMRSRLEASGGHRHGASRAAAASDARDNEEDLTGFSSGESADGVATSAAGRGSSSSGRGTGAAAAVTLLHGRPHIYDHLGGLDFQVGMSMIASSVQPRPPLPGGSVVVLRKAIGFRWFTVQPPKHLCSTSSTSGCPNRHNPTGFPLLFVRVCFAVCRYHRPRSSKPIRARQRFCTAQRARRLVCRQAALLLFWTCTAARGQSALAWPAAAGAWWALRP